MRKLTCLFILFFAPTLHAVEWSRNDIVKFTASSLRIGSELSEIRGIRITNSTITGDPSMIEADTAWGVLSGSETDSTAILSTTVPRTPWLRTETISVGDSFMLGSAFVNMKVSDPDSYVLFVIRDLFTDDIIFEHRFDSTVSIPLVNVFNKEVTVALEFYGQGAEVYSFGLRRIFERLIETNDVALSPSMLFYGEEPLDIRFKLRVPSWMDVIVFDNSGKLVDYVLKETYLEEGEYLYQWEPLQTSSIHELTSGMYYVYIRARSLDGKCAEISRRFQFANR